MFKRLPKTLTANLATSGTLKLGVLDKVALRDSGHRLFANGVRYNANTDFTIAADPNTGEGTLTWLHATTLTSGSIILIAIAFIDSISSSDGSGGGGGDATAAKQDAQTDLLEDISVKLDAATAIDQTTPGTTNGVVILDGSGNAIDQSATVNVAQDSAAMKLGATSVTPKFAAISSTGSGDTLALVSGKKIRVLSLFLLVAGATTVKFQSGATTDKTGAMSFPANGGISLPFNPIGHFETAVGEKLNHVLGSSVGIAGGFTYIEV